jgi:hypothetical protein
MDCTDVYREALTQDFSSTGSSAPSSAPVRSQRPAAEAGRDGVAGGAVAESRPAMAPAQGATAVDGEAVDQR